MRELKTIRTDAIPRAMEKAERYRLLNEPREAISICRDVLAAAPDHQEAIITLLLALTDMFHACDLAHREEAESLLPRISDEHARLYFEGVIRERWAKGKLDRHAPNDVVYGELAAAMACYEKAHRISPDGDDDAALRWNTCVRLLDDHPDLKPSLAAGADQDAIVDEDMPVR